MEHIARDEAFALLKKYNKDPFHIQHALTVEAVMKWYAKELGYGDDAEYWGIVGLLHDIDFELYPEEHCLKAPELLRDLRLAGSLLWNSLPRNLCFYISFSGISAPYPWYSWTDASAPLPRSNR